MEKWTQEQYEHALREKKQQAHDEMKLYIVINAKELQDECEPGSKNLSAVCKAMLNVMLEGDGFEVEPKIKSKIAGKLSVRYYTDNLSPQRRTYAQAMADAASSLS